MHRHQRIRSSVIFKHDQRSEDVIRSDVLKLSTKLIKSKFQGSWTKHYFWHLFSGQKMTFSPYLVSDIIQISLIKSLKLSRSSCLTHTYNLFLFLSLVFSIHLFYPHTLTEIQGHYGEPLSQRRSENAGQLNPKTPKSMIRSLWHGLILSYSCLIHNRQTDQKTLSCSKRSSLGSL